MHIQTHAYTELFLDSVLFFTCMKLHSRDRIWLAKITFSYYYNIFTNMKLAKSMNRTRKPGATESEVFIISWKRGILGG